MTDKDIIPLSRAIRILMEEYFRALNSNHIKRPINYALYHAWRRMEEADAKKESQQGNG